MPGVDAIYKAEAMINIDSKNYTGIVALYEDKCIFYNDEKLINEFKFDIKKTEIISDECEIDFLGLYKKTKEFVLLKFENNESIKYFLNDRRIDLFIGKFEQRKAEVKNYNLVVKALELGYHGKEEGYVKSERKISRKENDKLIRKVADLRVWEDLLTPVEWRDYYHSLSEPGKKVYNAILNGIVSCADQVRVDDVKLSNDAVGVIYHYILWDNPAIFCIGEYAMWRAVKEDGKHIEITSLCGGKSDEQELRNEVLRETKKILSTPGIYDYSEIQKEKFIHDYIVKNWPYDETCGNGGARLEPYTVYGALVQKTAVCEGFSKTAKMLLDILGVHTQVVSGTIVSKNAGHAWNAIKIGNKTYHLDITFDLGQTGGPQYAIRYDYFNVTDDDLTDRTWQDKQVVWICSEREHSYPSCVGGVVTNIEELQRYIYKELKKHKAYMYVKLDGDISKQKTKIDLIQGQYEAVRRECRISSRARTMKTDLKNLYVIAVNY